MYAAAPFWRAYLEHLGVRNIVWSDPTTEEMWHEGGKYGSVDPCFPSKVVQAHIHELLFHKPHSHARAVVRDPRDGPRRLPDRRGHA